MPLQKGVEAGEEGDTLSVGTSGTDSSRLGVGAPGSVSRPATDLLGHVTLSWALLESHSEDSLSQVRSPVLRRLRLPWLPGKRPFSIRTSLLWLGAGMEKQNRLIRSLTLMIWPREHPPAALRRPCSSAMVPVLSHYLPPFLHALEPFTMQGRWYLHCHDCS